MHDLGGIIWIIIVLIGVISSIRRNMQRARAQAQASAGRPPAAAQPAPPQPQPARQAQAQRLVQTLAPRTAAQPFELPPVVAPPPKAPPAPPPLQPQLARIGTAPVRGMFGSSGTLVHAIIAAEVLGPPKATQEQTIWSPRHSEPSI